MTTALRHLESKGAVVAKRGIIAVQDRRSLEGLAHGIYGVAEAEQKRLTGWKPLTR